MGILRKRIGKPTLERDIVIATATRAIYAGEFQAAELEFTFQTRNGEVIQVHIPLTAGAEFINQAIAAHSAAAPKIKGISFR